MWQHVLAGTLPGGQQKEKILMESMGNFVIHPFLPEIIFQVGLLLILVRAHVYTWRASHEARVV